MENFNVYNMKVGDSFEWLTMTDDPQIIFTTTKISKENYESTWTRANGDSYKEGVKGIINYTENPEFKLLRVNFNPFTKSDLISGEHVVETKEGNRYLVVGDYLIGETGYLCLSRYQNDLTYVKDACCPEFSVVKVFNGKCATGIHAGDGVNSYMNNDNLKLIYDRKENDHRASQQAKLRSLEESIAEQQKAADKLRQELEL